MLFFLNSRKNGRAFEKATHWFAAIHSFETAGLLYKDIVKYVYFLFLVLFRAKLPKLHHIG